MLLLLTPGTVVGSNAASRDPRMNVSRQEAHKTLRAAVAEHEKPTQTATQTPHAIESQARDVFAGRALLHTPVVPAVRTCTKTQVATNQRCGNVIHRWNPKDNCAATDKITCVSSTGLTDDECKQKCEESSTCAAHASKHAASSPPPH